MIYNYSYWEIPSSIDLEDFINKHPPKFKYKVDHFYHIIEYLCRGMEQEDLDSNSGFINMSSKKLQKVVPNYRKYLDHLLQHRFILTDMTYIAGEKCLGYLINSSKEFKSDIQLIPIQTSVIKKNRSIENKAFNGRLQRTRKQYPYLTKWFNSKLVIDVENAKKKIDELFPKHIGGIGGTKRGKPSNSNRRIKAIYSIHRFSKQDFYYSVDDNVGRFHSNLTNIKRELRHYITYDGQKLVNIDIKNSQPLLSTILLREEFYSENDPFLTIHKMPKLNSLLSNSIHSNSSFIIMLGKTLQNSDIKEFEKYIAMVNSGEFYEKMSQEIYHKTSFNKQKMKEMIFTVFFSDNRFIGQPEAKEKRDFRDNFPSVYNVFKALKKIDHRALAHILQRIESELIVQRVTKRISVEKPELPIFTIHDSVATTVGNEDYVSEIIIEEAFKLTGLTVKVGLEYWDF